ncbi:peptide deformylase [Thalassorhabdomicrobium marinisediminis]|uniref:Peptide deformylase n=1 Tax=Thalassorhabdomicrobium marinisediminis TaxID=2170577 RepID=A0A2T7FW24_9RHOB|nr:peptide deformylase [Thalassorhabdomicrobium marinisediminis]PVA06358.1 peptide deformylase [Thalassorhabdomicrobium marinisediminis]
MAVRELRLWPDPVLSQVCDPVDPADPELGALIGDLFDTLYAAGGRGLAAPQIAVLHRVFVVDVTWKEGARDPRVFINPVLEKAHGEAATMDEQCLSIPDLPMPVTRPQTLRLTWDAQDGTRMSGTFDGILARCIQHELDHLNGTVIFDHQSPEDRAALEARYAA